MDNRRVLDSDETDTRTALEKHIAYFGGETKKEISFTSINEHNQKINHPTPAWNAFIVSAASGIKIHGCPFATFSSKEAVGVLNHPYSTGIYNLDGTVNYERFNEVMPYSQIHEGRIILTENQFYSFLNTCRQKETRSDSLGTGMAASNAEWESFWNKIGFANGQLVTGEKYVTVNRLRKFFEDSERIGKKIENNISRHL